MDATDRGGVIRLVEAESCIPGLAGERAVLVLQRGTLDIRLSMPVPPNQQTPHEQDELYVVIRGCGFLVHDDKRTGSIRATSCSWLLASRITTRTSATIWLCGA
jgi:hypothetical protein